MNKLIYLYFTVYVLKRLIILSKKAKDPVAWALPTYRMVSTTNPYLIILLILLAVERDQKQLILVLGDR